MAMLTICICKTNEKTQKNVMNHGNDDYLSLRNDQKTKYLDNFNNNRINVDIWYNRMHDRMSALMRMQMEKW